MSSATIGGVRLSAAQPRIAISFWRVAAAADLQNLKQRGLDIAEIRLDKATARKEADVRALCESFSAVPTLLTIRLAAEGGDWLGEEEERRRLFLLAMPYCDAVDIELASPLLSDIIACAHEQKKTVIVSRHNFTAADDAETLEKARTAAINSGADIFKTAGLCTSESAWKTLAIFAKDCCTAALPCAIIGMDDGSNNIYAQQARRELPLLGSCLAFAADGKTSAPGQLSLNETAAALRKAADEAD